MLILASLVVGLSLGLMGAGGSILTVPLLMLLMGMGEKAAIVHGLLIVPAIAAVGASVAARRGGVNVRVLGLFALSSMPAASLGAFLGMQLPNGIQTLILAVLMMFAAFKMIASSRNTSTPQISRVRLLFAGGGAGLLTGLVGVGGGFLIVPALVLYAGLSMHSAVANSLILIVLNALLAFVTASSTNAAVMIEWHVVAVMSGIGGIAVAAAQITGAMISQVTLKRGFAYCLMLISVGMALNVVWPLTGGEIL